MIADMLKEWVRVDTIIEKRKEFFKILANIQEREVEIGYSNYMEGDDIENLLYDVTFNMIVDFMVLIDGYYDHSDLKVDLIDQETRIPIRKGTELHDDCVEYIKYEKWPCRMLSARIPK